MIGGVEPAPVCGIAPAAERARHFRAVSATVRLPAYPVGRLRTGQWSPDEGELWAVEVTPPPR